MYILPSYVTPCNTTNIKVPSKHTLTQPDVVFPYSLQVKLKMQEFLDSVIQKSGKIRALVRDIKENYTNSEVMSRPHPILLAGN